MPAISLTDISVRSLKLPERGQVTYWDANLPGFGVRVSQGGAKSFVVVYGQNRRRHTIGGYPTLSLKTARSEAKRLQAELVLGVHKKSSTTFSDALERYIETCRQKNKPRTVSDYRRIFKRHFRFGKVQLKDITRADIQRLLDKLRATPSEQNHAFVALRIFFNWAAREELIETSPMVNMRPIGKSGSRDRILSDSELSNVTEAALEHPYPFGPIIMLLALTGQRRGEIAALEWEWIDRVEQTITLPTTLTKNKRLHVFPYGDRTAELLEALPRTGAYLFPARTEAATTFNGWGKSKARFDTGLDGVQPYTLHDLRRTFSSTLARLNTPIHVTEKLLNHVSGTISGVAAIYNRHSYMEEMREAIAAYEAHLAKLVGQTNGLPKRSGPSAPTLASSVDKSSN